ncbi:hypothetical protein SAMD00019534_005960, partial [Acytostelium subglobosum LB1]|uniref:hypothetical protein n=1 Tax=Acytostelium subglobosum LB1 TaxID=1410327 RepID=UPI0006449440
MHSRIAHNHILYYPTTTAPTQQQHQQQHQQVTDRDNQQILSSRVAPPPFKIILKPWHTRSQLHFYSLYLTIAINSIINKPSQSIKQRTTSMTGTGHNIFWTLFK